MKAAFEIYLLDNDFMQPLLVSNILFVNIVHLIFLIRIRALTKLYIFYKKYACI